MKSKRHRKQKPQPQDKKAFFPSAKKVQTKDDAAALQSKLEIGKPNDKFEQEADAVADQVVKQNTQQQADHNSVQRKKLQRQEKEEEPAAKLQRQEKEEEPAAKLQRQEKEEEPAAKLQRQEKEEEPAAKLQRQEKEEEPAAKLQRQEKEEEPAAKLQRQEKEEEPAAKLQRQEKEEEPAAKLQRKENEEEKLQTKPDSVLRAEKKGNRSGKDESQTSSAFETRLQNSKGKGMSLPDDVRIEMEQKMKADFSKVNIHTDEEAIELAQMIKAQAFTHGYDIYFNKGKYNPYSTSGKHLLAHELAHVVQQKG